MRPDDAPMPGDDDAPDRNVTSIAKAKRARAGARVAKGLAKASGDPRDLDTARRFAGKACARFRYCAFLDKWFWFDGRRWTRDELERVREAVKETADDIRDEAAALADDELWKHAKRIGTARGVGDVLALARSEPSISIAHDAFDRDAWALNVMNGTIDLRTGMLKPHNSADMITKLAPVAFDPAARSELWDRFLRDALGDDDVIAFVQRAVGYSLTADASEEKAFLCVGPTRCGKGTLSDAIAGAIGDYARGADFKTFLADKHDAGASARPDLFRLIGSRFVTTSEVSPTARFDEARLKSLTGRDPMPVRTLYGETVEARPTFKLWFSCNTAPRISSDDAVWARLIRISFARLASVPLDRRDPTLKTRLADPEVGGPAILAWAVRGCLDWQHTGLAAPASVLAGTAELRDELDSARRFLVAHVMFEPGASTTTANLMRAYEAWCEEEGEQPSNAKTLTNALKKRGAEVGMDVANTRTRTQRGWAHVRLVGVTGDACDA